MTSYRLLKESDFDEIHRVFIESFADYVIEYKPNKAALRRKFFRENIDYSLSVGAFAEGQMVGFTMNGVGNWNGQKTAYDAGTGVIKKYRRQGISSGIFDFIIPVLRENKIKQYLLEVISVNLPAIELYKKLDFKTQRNLIAFKSPKPFLTEKKDFPLEVKKLKNVDWDILKTFGECLPSWQNSFASIEKVVRSNSKICLVLGLYLENALIGYGVVFPSTGNVPLIAIDPRFRRQGFGSFLLNNLQNASSNHLVITNIDEKATHLLSFFQKHGFSIFAEQQEMLLKI